MSCIFIKLDDARLPDWDETPQYKSCSHTALAGISGTQDGWSTVILIF